MNTVLLLVKNIQFFKPLLTMVSLFLLLGICAPQSYAKSDMLIAAQSKETPEVDELLHNMAHALRHLNYQGRFVYQRQDNNQGSFIISYDIVHVLKAGKEYERILKIDGKQEEFIREGKVVDCYHPGELILQGSLPHELVKKLGVLQDNYHFTVDGETRVAMRDAWQLTIIPKDQYRYGYRFLIDKANFMLLEGQWLTKNKKPLEQFHFVQINFSDFDERLLEPTTKNVQKVMAGECQKNSHDMGDSSVPWEMDLPQGYMFCAYNAKGSQPDAIVGSSVYSDGLSSFSVFIGSGYELEDGLNKDSYREGSTLMYSKHVQLNNQPYTVTIVGGIPEVTAEKLVNSLREK